MSWTANRLLAARTWKYWEEVALAIKQLDHEALEYRYQDQSLTACLRYNFQIWREDEDYEWNVGYPATKLQLWNEDPSQVDATNLLTWPPNGVLLSDNALGHIERLQIPRHIKALRWGVDYDQAGFVRGDRQPIGDPLVYKGTYAVLCDTLILLGDIGSAEHWPAFHRLKESWPRDPELKRMIKKGSVIQESRYRYGYSHGPATCGGAAAQPTIVDSQKRQKFSEDNGADSTAPGAPGFQAPTTRSMLGSLRQISEQRASKLPLRKRLSELSTLLHAHDKAFQYLLSVSEEFLSPDMVKLFNDEAGNISKTSLAILKCIGTEDDHSDDTILVAQVEDIMSRYLPTSEGEQRAPIENIGSQNDVA